MAKKRKNGEGSIHQRKDGRWEGRYVIGYDDNGYPKTKNVLAKTKKDCEAKLKVLKEECGGIKSEKIKAGMRFDDWLEYWYLNYSKPKLRTTTQQTYENCMHNHIIPVLGKTPLAKLTQSDIQEFLNETKRNGRVDRREIYGAELSNRTVRGCYAVCKMALDKAVEENLIRVNPAVGCKLPPKKSREMQVLTKEELQRFLIQAKEDGFYEVFMLEMATGMRRGELLALQWDDLDFETGRLNINKQVYTVRGKLMVNEPKTKSSIRTIILPPAMVEILKEHKRGVFSRWMFPARLKYDQPYNPNQLLSKMKEILEKAQCKKIRFHDLRHTFATMALENGMDVKTLSTIIGHVSADTTLDIYAHTTSQMQKTAATAIDKGFGNMVAQCDRGEEEDVASAKVEFTPVKSGRRRPGTGCISQISDHLWEGRYSPVWPDGKKHARNVYADTLEKCEELLAELIIQMKAEIAAIRAGKVTEYPDGVSPKKKAIAAYMRAHPGVTNKSVIARETKMDRTTVQRYYDELRAEFAMQ